MRRLLATSVLTVSLVACGHRHHSHRDGASTPGSGDGDALPAPSDDGDAIDGGVSVPAADVVDGATQRHCRADGANVVVSTKQDAPTSPLEDLIDPDPSTHASVWRNETWRPGERFGTAPADHPNHGYSADDGTIVDGAPAAPPPKALACTASAFAFVGWRYANDVDGLLVDADLRRVSLQHGSEGSVTLTRWLGKRHARYHEPAAAAAADGLDRGYFSDAARIFVVTRTVTLGDDDGAPEVAIARQVGDAAPTVRRYELRTPPEAPIVETLVRRVDGGTAAPGWRLSTRRLESGALVARFADGTQTRLDFNQLSFSATATGALSCVPQSGDLTLRVTPPTPSAGAPQVEIARHVVAKVVTDAAPKCTPATTPEACAAAAARAVDAFGVSGCLF